MACISLPRSIKMGSDASLAVPARCIHAHYRAFWTRCHATRSGSLEASFPGRQPWVAHDPTLSLLSSRESGCDGRAFTRRPPQTAVPFPVRPCNAARPAFHVRDIIRNQFFFSKSGFYLCVKLKSYLNLVFMTFDGTIKIYMKFFLSVFNSFTERFLAF